MNELEMLIIDKVVSLPISKWDWDPNFTNNALICELDDIKYKISIYSNIPYKFEILFVETVEVIRIPVTEKIHTYVELILAHLSKEKEKKRLTQLATVVANLSLALHN